MNLFEQLLLSLFLICVVIILKIKLQESAVKAEDEETSKNFETGKWKKSESIKKTRYYYRSVDDVIEKGKRPGAYRNLGTTR